MTINVAVFNGSSNRIDIGVKPDGDAEGLDLTPDGYIDFSSPTIDKVVFAAQGKIIDSNSDSIDIVNGNLEIVFGDMNLEDGAEEEGLLLVYVVGEAQPVVVAAPGLMDNFYLTVSSVPTIQ